MALIEIKHKCTGAVLYSLECDSLSACVEAAAKAEANLAEANLAGANLAGANLVNTEYSAQLGFPNGWPAFAWSKDNVVRVQVGCRNFTLTEGRAYWAGKDNRREVLAALDYAEWIANLRGWIKADAKKVAA